MNLIEINLQRIIDLCHRYKVKTLAVFGSILTERFNDKSDIDLLVTFEPHDPDNPGDFDYVRNYFDLKDAFAKLLGREIDLIEEDALRNKYFIRNVNRTKQIIYG